MHEGQPANPGGQTLRQGNGGAVPLHATAHGERLMDHEVTSVGQQQALPGGTAIAAVEQLPARNAHPHRKVGKPVFCSRGPGWQTGENKAVAVSGLLNRDLKTKPAGKAGIGNVQQILDPRANALGASDGERPPPAHLSQAQKQQRKAKAMVAVPMRQPDPGQPVGVVLQGEKTVRHRKAAIEKERTIGYCQ